MKTSQIYDVHARATLDEVILELKEDANSANTNTKVRTYSSVKQLNLPNTATLVEVVEALPDNSTLMFYFDVTKHPNMSLPQPNGLLRINKGAYVGKAYITFYFDSYTITQSYIESATPKLRSWVGVGYVGATAASVGGLSKKIPIAGITYYFTYGESQLLTDRPAGAGAAIISKQSFGNNNYVVTYQENFDTMRKWVCRDENGTTSNWVQVVGT